MAHVIIGLGNPGGEYAKTRHNAGRMAAEYFVVHAGFESPTLKKSAQALVTGGVVGDEKVIVALPEVFMNLSGKTALALVKSKPAAKKLLVVRDDLDMPLGAIKMTIHGRGSGGHKGVESIARALKTKDFVQLKIGISGSTASGKLKKVSGEEQVVKHVIGAFKPSEANALANVMQKASHAIEIFITDGVEKAMLYANTKN